MSSIAATTTGRALRTPRAAAVAGIVFSVLFATSVVLLEWALPSESSDAGTWVEDDSRRTAVSVSLQLLPFAGIAFLWFIGVLRDRIGSGEDRFFATVFLGSGLLFLAMVFVATAMAGALVASTSAHGTEGLDPDVVDFGRALMLQVSNVYAVRMAGVFMISLATIWLRTGLMPRWLAVVTYALALTLLVVTTLSLWVTLLFPAWALTISTFLLVRHPSRAG
jgi:hypothetical protein